MFEAQSNQQHVPNILSPVGGVSAVQSDSGCVYSMTEPPSQLVDATFHPQKYYMTTMGLAPAVVTTSATPWQTPTPYIPPPPVSSGRMAGTYGTPPKPEMTFLFPVCMASSETGHMVSPAPPGVVKSSTTVSTPPASTTLNPLMNSTKCVDSASYSCHSYHRVQSLNIYLCTG